VSVPSSDRERFLALCRVDGAFVRERDGRVDVGLSGLWRMFASWVDAGTQRGVHLRGESGVASEAFRRPHNWIFVGVPVWSELPALLATARAIAARRGGGLAPVVDLYKPLAKAVAAASRPPAGLHAGGPRAKVLGGEHALVIALCDACAARLPNHFGPDDAATLRRLRKAIAAPQPGVGWWGEANLRGTGREHERREAEDAEAATVQLARAQLGARNAGALTGAPYATKALVRTVRELERGAAGGATEFLVEVDDLILRHELAAAISARGKVDTAPAIARVLWRGADAKGFPAWWLARLASGDYGVLGKFGTRWMWHVTTRDAAYATLPDEQLEAAAELAPARDA
jgi:hypothetical protein